LVFYLLRFWQIVGALHRRCSLLGLLKTRHKRGLFLPWKYASNRRASPSPSRAVVGLFSFFKWGGGGLYPTRRRPCRFSHCPQGQISDNAISCCFVFVHALAWRNCAAGGI